MKEGPVETTSDEDPALPSPVGESWRVLFLDDDRRRADVFLALCPAAVWVETAEDCITRLVESWDEVHLDHDLGGEQFVDVNRDDCGMAVVRWLCAEPRSQLRNTRFFIHSYNIAAASLMVQCLIQASYTAEFRPFGLDLVDLLSFEETPSQQRAETSEIRPQAWPRRWKHRLAGLFRVFSRLF